MQKIDIRLSSPKISQVHSICGYLGSFDPLHKGHEWIIAQLLVRFDAVMLLVPALHFEKTVQFPLNATYEQRLTMLTSFAKRKEGRIAVGLAHEVLFIKLAACLAERFPTTEIFFGMGNETFEKFLHSQTYYARAGLAWTAAEQVKLEQLWEKIVIFGRSGNNGHCIAVPEDLRRISSTQVRETVKALWRMRVSEVIWREQLEKLISPEIVTFILREGLYVAG